MQNVIRSSFCIPKVVRIGAYKGANYSLSVGLQHFKRKIRKFTSFFLFFFGGGGGGWGSRGIVTSLAYIYTMGQKDSCQRMVYGE